MSSLYRIFSSPEEINQQTDEALINGLQSQFPIENKHYLINLSNPYADKKYFDHEDEKDAILRSRSLTYPIRGDLTLISKATGKVIDEEKNFPLMDSFTLTGKHTVVYNGNNYAIANQLQLRPGIYTRRGKTGELEAHVNTGTGRSFTITLEPKTSLFYLNVASSSIPLAPLLTRVFNINPAEVTKYIPKPVWQANLESTQGKETKIINDLFAKLVSTSIQRKGVAVEDKPLYLQQALESSELSAKTTKITLGKEINSVTSEAILLALRNLVDVQIGEKEEDNRDSLQFKRVQNLPDYLTRRFALEHQSVVKIKNKLSFNLEKLSATNPKIRDAIPSKPFSKIYSSYILESPLSSPPSETNPIESLEHVGKVTVLGEDEGGISSERGVPMPARNIDPSHLGIIDPSRTPESSHAGIDQRFTIDAHRDREGNLYSRVRNKAGKIVDLSVLDMMNSVIGFPNQKGDVVQVQDKGELTELPRSKVDYWIPSSTSLYTITTNLVPFLNSNHPGRLTMAGKAIPQALSLVNREQPLVQTLAGNGVPFVKSLGHIITNKSPVEGTIMEIGPTSISIKDHETKKTIVQKLVKNLPFNMKGFLDDETPLVAVGDKVKKNQILFDNNYSKDGALALGKNLMVAYMPYKGYNHEDGIIISKSAAESMSSHHAYKVDYDVLENSILKKPLLRRYFPGKFTKEQLDILDDKGFPLVGSVIKHGDPVYAVLERREPSPEDKMLGRLHKTLVNPYRLVTEIWNHDEPGTVVDAHTASKSVRILLRSIKPLEIGDKLTGLHGNKGIVSLILEDHKMPFNKESGKPVDLLLNPASVTSRINLGQLLETAAGKIAQKTGKPYLVENFSNDSNLATISKELKEHGIKDTEELIEPSSNKSYGQVLTGPQYILKLYKTTDSNYSARNTGAYDNILQPVKGGEEGSKAVGYMEFLGLLGSNARKNLKEIGTLKSEENSDYWSKFLTGQPLPKPRSTFATQKFFDYLHGSGIKTSVENGKITVSPLTDHDIVTMSNGEIIEPLMISSKNMESEDTGLFDTAITGGLKGKNWSHYTLAEPIVNPIFENPVKALLNISTDEFAGIASGTHGVRKTGKNSYDLVDSTTGEHKRSFIFGPTEKQAASKEEPILVGGPAFQEMLSGIDVAEHIASLREEIPVTKSVSKKDKLIKQLRFLHGLKKTGLDPETAYIIHNMPVIPPISRPVTMRGGNSLEYADINQLYKDHMLVNKSLKGVVDLLPPGSLVAERKDLYNGARAVMGLSEAISGASRGRKLKGLLWQIGGEGGPKGGLFQDKLLKKKQDFSGRATIYAEPNLGFNELAVPKEALWTMYKYHIIRDMVKKGYNYIDAEKAWTARNDSAMGSFSKLTKDIPILMNRAPTLMKSNISAYYPIPVEGRTIGVNPLHLGLISGDYDGDAVSLYLPMTSEAIDEAKTKMLPQHQIYDYRKGFGSTLMAPAHEAILGSVHLTEPNTGKEVKHFKSEADVLEALKNGTITEDHPIIIKGK